MKDYPTLLWRKTDSGSPVQSHLAILEPFLQETWLLQMILQGIYTPAPAHYPLDISSKISL